MKQPLKIAVMGTGYWAQFQIAAWQAIGCEVVAVWNRTRRRAEETAARFGIPAVYDTPEALLAAHGYDLVDIIADAEAHEPLVMLAAAAGKDVICQKPMALDTASCARMVEACREAGVWFAIHENFRYQPQFQTLKQQLAQADLGRVLHAHIQMKSPDRDIIAKQPALSRMEHMALRDMGPHMFDVVRFLFGEAEDVLAVPVSSYPDIPVDDTAVALLRMQAGHPVLCTLAHRFMYKAFIQCERGSVTLDDRNDLLIQRLGSGDALSIPYQEAERLPYIPEDDWRIHGGHVFMAIPACLQALRDAYAARTPAETSGEDNLKTMQVVFAAMHSVQSRQPAAVFGGEVAQR